MEKIVFFWEKLEILHNLEILSKNSFEYLLLLKKLLKKRKFGLFDNNPKKNNFWQGKYRIIC